MWAPSAYQYAVSRQPFTLPMQRVGGVATCPCGRHLPARLGRGLETYSDRAKSSRISEL